MSRYQLYFGIGLVLFILGVGVLMSLYIIKRDRAEISQTELKSLVETVNQLVALQNQNPILKADDESPVIRSGPIAINRASQTELEQLTGIGPVRAIAIIEARTSGGQFHDLDDLRARVPKVPKSVIEDISQEITFE